MATSTLSHDPRRDAVIYDTPRGGGGSVSGPSAVSWAAVFAGAAAAAALSLCLMLLGTGLGLSAMSPWAEEGVSGKTLGVGTGVWLVLIHVLASALGGYIGGRLRTKWVSLETDEVAFRDTAHGFLTWAVSILLTAGVLTSAVTTIVERRRAGWSAGRWRRGERGDDRGGERCRSRGRGRVQVRQRQRADGVRGRLSLPQSQGRANPKARRSRPRPKSGASSPTPPPRGKLPEEDARYAGQLVAQRTGISQAEGEKRVNEAFNQVQQKKQEAETKAREAADAARKASAAAALFLFITLLIGAFVASYSAIVGGRQRDD